MDLLAVLTTGTRNEYLRQTLWSLDLADAGLLRRAVFVDGPLISNLGWPCYSVAGDDRVGNLEAFLRVFRTFLEFEYDRLLLFEDDIIACKNAIPKMIEVGIPEDCALTTFFDMKDCPRGASNGLYKIPATGNDGRGLWGTQAALFPRRTLEYLVSHKKFWVDGVPNRHCADCLFSHQLLYSPWPQYALYVPNLVEHVGDTSAIWSWTPKVNRKSTSFPGEDFDALSLSS